MSTKSPAFQFYAHDFLAGRVATYTLEEIGAYSTLLAYDWTLSGLPVEPEKLARLLRISRRKFDAIWAVIGEQFPEQDGRRYNRRLQLEREKQSANRTKRQAAAHTRWNAHADANAKHLECPPTPTPSPTPVSTSTTTTPATAGTAEPPVIRVKKPKPSRPPAPWMGRLNAAWKALMGGNLPPGSATLLSPVVADVGEEESERRLTRYLEETDPEYASVRNFASKHGRYADPGPLVDPATGLLNEAGLRAVGGRR